MTIVVAIVVLYNPDYAKLYRLFLSVCSQVSSIIFVDNTSNIEGQNKNKQWIKNLDYLNGHYLSMNDNLGIATAQNKGIEFAKTLDAQFVLLLDQDSVLPNNMVSDLLGAYQKLSKNHQVACVAPSFLDRKNNQISPVIQYGGLSRKRIMPKVSDGELEVAHIIASGMLIPVEVFDVVGLKQDNLFIDYVDIEWCLRAGCLGHKTFVVPKVVMQHDIGDDMVQVGNRSIMLHSDFRNYFAIRNAVFLMLYRKLPLPFKIWEMFKLPVCLVVYALASKKSLQSFKIMLIAIKDGVIKNMGKGYFENRGL